ncbi:calcium-transporting P-type ATPase, PMR1-type [Candidatus Woesearchaeota archaeon]|nr:calcium-transporting P-type ATPase, PMR1-type [Candidatus Woesearchaeota archaeon]
MTKLNTRLTGLSSDEAARRLQAYGKNEVQQKKGESALQLFFDQFKSPIVWILIGAVVISALEEEFIDAVVISLILILNAILGFVQEYKAEKTIEALQKLASFHARVVRDGKEMSIEAKDVVPGDIILLEVGEKIPADIRLFELVDMETQEGMLTGESMPVTKKLLLFPESTPIADQKNMAFAGTIIARGHGKGVVCRTGMDTEIGKIARLIQETESEPTPLQKKLKKLGTVLGIGTIVICAIIFFAGVLKGEDPAKFLIVAVALAVAAIPEGLPAIVTISLAIGVQRLAKHNVLLRKLPSGETLGCTTVICTDKTGTLTHNEMTIKRLWVDNTTITVSGSGYSLQGEFSATTPTLRRVLEIGALNNDAKLSGNTILGDPTEGALLVSAAKNKIDYQLLNIKHKRVDEIPFTSERKRMVTVHCYESGNVVYVKGAVDVLLNLCTFIEINGKKEMLTRQKKQEILEKNELFAKDALRVLGFAYKKIKGNEKKELYEKDLIFVGMQAMIDPPREEVKASIATCHKAGIRVVMITGDHIATAVAIAKEIGIDGRALGGHDIDTIDLDSCVEDIRIYARVNPEHKLKIVEALKKKGHIVAMTGDGVNDAPALKRADIGVAMGLTGTDVTKEAADIILTDDNFTSIVRAIEVGRSIYDNIQKFVIYLLSSNMGEVLTLFLAILLGFPLPVAAIMLLWINLVTDGLPAIALGLEPEEKDIMNRPPRKPKSQIVSKTRGAYLLTLSCIMSGGTLLLFVWALLQRGWVFGTELHQGEAYIYATTMAFTSLVMFQMFNVINCRSDHQSIFKLGLFSNMKLIGAIGVSILLHLSVVYGPLEKVFGTTALSLADWLLILLVTSSVVWFGELVKLYRRIRQSAGAEFIVN